MSKAFSRTSYLPVEDGEVFGMTIGHGAPPISHLPPRSFEKNWRHKTWVRGLWQTFVFVLFIAPPFAFLVAANWLLSLRAEPSMASDLPDGDFTWQYMNYTAGCFGNSGLTPDYFLRDDLTFEEAKIIDIGWNVIIGRGCQALLGYGVYRVAVDTLGRIAEHTPVSYQYFTTVSFYPTSLVALPNLLVAVVSLRSWRAKVATLWLVISCLIVALMPTLLDAMTGYVQAQEVWIITPDNKRVNYNDVTITNDTTAYWSGDVFYAPPAYILSSDHRICLPVGPNTYKWGFASGICTVIWLIYMGWGIGTWGVWLDAQHNCQQVRKGRSMDVYSAVVDISGAMRNELGPHVVAYSGREVRKELKGRASVMYATTEDPVQGLVHIGLTPERHGKLKLNFQDMYG